MSICSRMEQRPPPLLPPRLDSSGDMPPMRYGPPKQSIWSTLKKLFGPLIVVAIILLKWGAKLKFIILPVIKFLPAILKTGGTMILSIGAYALASGWRFAVGFVLLIFVHECGHLVAAKRLGLRVGAPVFIPFMGALIALKDAPKNAWIEAQVGIGGPIFGALAAVVCHVIYLVTGQQLYLVLANVGYLLNLFNLAPIGFLDGGRIATALSPWLWVIGTVIIGVLMVLHFNVILLLVFVMSLPRLVSLFRKRSDEEKRYFEVTPQQRLIMAVLYFGLAAALAYGMKMTPVPPVR
jgi:Zn-dependent protease